MEHFLKFLVVGSIGFIINTTVLVLGVRKGFKPSVSGPVGAEIAITSNFLLNNFWTFSDKSITSWDVLPSKFLTFNILSLSSIVIQFVFLKTGEKIFGLKEFKEPFLESTRVKNLTLLKPIRDLILDLIEKIPALKKINKKLTTYMIFYMAGVGFGLVVNFIIYSQIIWK